MANNHGFIDGNKRTAWMLAELLITRSGYRLDIPDNEPIDDLVVDVTTGAIDFDKLTAWFKERIVKAP